MRRVLSMVVALSWFAAVPGVAQPTAAPDTEIAGLRQLLEDAQRRLSAVEQAQARPAGDEVASLRLLLQDVGRRIAALEGAAPAAVTMPAPVTSPVVLQAQSPWSSTNKADGSVLSAGAAAEAATPSEEAQGVWPTPFPDDRTPPDADTLKFYGSFRVRLAASEKTTEIADRSSRAGLSSAIRWGSRWRYRGFGRVEFGFNMVNNAPVFVTGGDPGFSSGQAGQAVTTRLGYVGVDTPFGTFSFGKQWSVYSDVSLFSDEFATYGGDASGTYNAGTDGGISGTGRAETAMQYRNKFGPLSLGLQAQFRSRTETARRLADTWGASSVLDLSRGFSVGAAFNAVRDGVDAPEGNQAKVGDKSGVVGLRFAGGHLQTAFTFHRSVNHEHDDLGRWVDAMGTELFAQYDLTPRWYVSGGYNHLIPDDDEPGQFRLRYTLAGFGYRWRADRAVMVEAKFEDSKKSDGRPSAKTVVTIGTNVGW